MKNQTGQKATKRYSQAFIQKIISEREEGKYSKSEAGKVYEVDPGTIHYW